MRIYRARAPVPAMARGAAVAIGNFDGVHRGHRAVLAAAAKLAHALKAPLGVITFEPHPREVMRPDAVPARLTPIRRKGLLFAGLGVQLLYVLRFDRALMQLSPEGFVSDVLVHRLGVRAVAAGEDFRFGYRRAGTLDELERLAIPLGIAVEAVPPVELEGRVCSSTRIREALAAGEVATAAGLLGYPYGIEGVVRPGDQRGRTIGFPTANVHPLGRRPFLPAPGVYAVEASLCHGPARTILPAVANLGWRPTFDGRSLLLEVHLLEGGRDLYGERMGVAFLERLRGEQKFAGIDELKAQIGRDRDAALAIHAGRALAESDSR